MLQSVPMDRKNRVVVESIKNRKFCKLNDKTELEGITTISLVGGCDLVYNHKDVLEDFQA